MINSVVLVGRLTKDPELKYTPAGIANVRFTIAVNRTFTNQNGEREADFISCVAWRKQAENLVNYQKKGALIGLEGRIQTGSYEGQDGKRVYTTDIVADSIQFLEPRNGGQGGAGQPQNGNFGGQQGGYNQPPNNFGGQQGGYNQPPNNFGGQQGGYNQPPNNFGGQQGGYNQPPNNFGGQQEHTRLDNDPFAGNGKGTIDVSEDDLPF